MDQEFGHWQAGGLPLRVEYSAAVMEELRVYGEEGFQKIPHGGIEVGALLLGDRDGQTVRIREWRPMTCDHARGPGFVLSPADCEALTALTASCAKAPELEGLSVVGWFHTHTRSKIFLSPEDLAIHNEYFTEPWHVAMVMRPQKDQVPAAGFFCRDEAGNLNGEFSASEFLVKPDPAQAMKPKRPSAAVPVGIPAGGAAPGRIMSGRPGGISSGQEAMARRERPMFRPMGDSRVPPANEAETGGMIGRTPLDSHVPLAPPRPARQRRGLGALPPRAEAADDTVDAGELPPPAAIAPRFPASWMAGALVVAVAMVAGLQLWRVTQHPTAAQLRVEEADQSLQISWDKSAVASADRAVLRLVDGATVRSVPLSQTAVRHGSVTYLRQADDVEVRLTLYQGDQPGAQMFARYVGAPGQAKAQGSTSGEYAAPSERRLQLQSDVARLRQALQTEADKAERLREELALLEKSSGGARAR